MRRRELDDSRTSCLIGEDLFRVFIVAASKLYGDAVVSSDPHLQELVSVYAMVSRMRVMCSPQTVECAEKIMVSTLDTSERAARSYGVQWVAVHEGARRLGIDADAAEEAVAEALAAHRIIGDGSNPPHSRGLPEL